MSYALIAALLVAVAAFFLFINLVRTRWFARFETGFLVALMLAAGGLSFTTASLFGLWGYEQGRAMLLRGLHAAMSNLADVIQEETLDDIAQAHGKVTRLAEELALEKLDGAAVPPLLERVQRFDPRFLHIDVVDRDGRVLASDRPAHEMEATDRSALPFNLEGKRFTSNPFFSSTFDRYVLNLGVPLKNGSVIIGAVTAWYDIQTDMIALLQAGRFGKSGNAVLVDGEGRIFAHPNPTRVGIDVSKYDAIKDAWAGNAGWVQETTPLGVERLFVYRPMPKVATVESRPWILLAGIDTSEAFAPIHALAVTFSIGIVAILLACVLLSRQLSVSIRHPVQQLVEFAHRVRDGDFQERVAVEGRDEMGQLASALNEMVDGLEERDRVKEVFGRYVTTKVREKLLQGNLKLGGELRYLTVLISDVRNFTAMSERMAAEEVVAFLNHYFSEMVEAVFEEEGVLDKFIGDGLLAVYGSLEETPDHARRAVRTALRMTERVEKINAERAAAGDPPMAIGIGIHTADVVVGNIGSRRRLEYTVIGDGVNTCSRIESLNKEFGTTILITESTYSALGDEFECRLMPEAHLKGKTRAPKVYEVVGERHRTSRSAVET